MVRVVLVVFGTSWATHRAPDQPMQQMERCVSLALTASGVLPALTAWRLGWVSGSGRSPLRTFGLSLDLLLALEVCPSLTVLHRVPSESIHRCGEKLIVGRFLRCDVGLRIHFRAKLVERTDHLYARGFELGDDLLGLANHPVALAGWQGQTWLLRPSRVKDMPRESAIDLAGVVVALEAFDGVSPIEPPQHLR